MNFDKKVMRHEEHKEQMMDKDVQSACEWLKKERPEILTPKRKAMLIELIMEENRREA